MLGRPEKIELRNQLIYEISDKEDPNLFIQIHDLGDCIKISMGDGCNGVSNLLHKDELQVLITALEGCRWNETV